MIGLEDILVAARTIYGEARGEEHGARVAVAHVIVNRWRKSMTEGTTRDSTIARVCYRDKQFSCWNANDPNFKAVQSVEIADEIFRDCMRSILFAIDAPTDLTEGALHYHDESISNPWPGHQPSLLMGRLYFYNTVPL